MSANEPSVMRQPTCRLRGILYATVLLAGGGVIGAVVIGPSLGQRYGDGAGPGPAGPRWHRFMDRQQGEDGGPGWRRGFGEHRFGRREDNDGRRMGGFGRMLYPGAIERRVNRLLDLVDGSTEQRQKVRAIYEKVANDLYPTRDKLL